MLDVQHLSVRYGSLTIVDDIGFTVEPGQWVMIVGPNGAGKSTLLNAISQNAPYTGSVLFAGEDVKKCKPRALARKIGLLSQSHFVNYAFTVEEVIRLGRYAYRPSPFSGAGDAGEDTVRSAVEKTGLAPLLRQSVLTLSGGELQRAFLAQLFAQDPKLLMLDEPTNHLDPAYQSQIFSLIRDWVGESGRAVMSVVHDLSLARAYGTHAILMDKGKILADGEIQTVMSRERLNAVYGMDIYTWMRRMYAQWEV